MEDNKIIDVEPIKDNIINPSTEKGNYLVQVISEGQVIKSSIALNATINIVSIGNQAIAVDIK